MNLPSSIGELTIDQFQSLYKLYKSDKDLIDKGLEAVSLLSGWDIEQVKKIDYKEISKPFSHISYLISDVSIRAFEKTTTFKPFIVIRGKAFKACMLNEFNTAQFLDIKNLSGNWIENLHLLMPCVYQPVNIVGRKKKYDGAKLEKYSGYFKDALLKDVVGLLFFYTNVFEKLSPTIQTSLEEATRTIEEVMGEIMEDSSFLQSIGVGDSSSISSQFSTELKKMKSMSGILSDS